MSELLDVFQSFRRVLCVCPCCGEMVRLSDLNTWGKHQELGLTSMSLNS